MHPPKRRNFLRKLRCGSLKVNMVKIKCYTTFLSSRRLSLPNLGRCAFKSKIAFSSEGGEKRLKTLRHFCLANSEISALRHKVLWNSFPFVCRRHKYLASHGFVTSSRFAFYAFYLHFAGFSSDNMWLYMGTSSAMWISARSRFKMEDCTSARPRIEPDLSDTPRGWMFMVSYSTGLTSM